MRRFILLASLFVAIAQGLSAKLKITTEADGTVVFKINTQGDINNEFTYQTYASYKASALVQPYLHKTKLKVVTADGVTMSRDDLDRICGMDDGENNFPNINTLDLEEASMAPGCDLTHLKFMDNLKTITFPRTTTDIPAGCLNYSSCKIEHVIIPDNDKRSVNINSQAFGVTLQTIKLGEVDPNGTSTVKEQAFLGCTALNFVDFGYGWKTIGRQAFIGCTALKDITLPEGVETIGYGAFSGSAIEAIRLPNTLKKIEATAFNCHYLKSITIPASVEIIEGQAFQENHALTDVYVLGTHTRAGNQAFDPSDVSFFNYSNPGSVSPVTRDNYKKNSNTSLTMLHYPAAAKNDYVNPCSRNAGGSTNSVAAQDGNFWPTLEDGKYSTTSGNYAGWNNFAISTPIRDDEKWEDDKRVDDKWYTMCLPFAMTSQQLKSAYGSKVEVVEFNEVKTGTDAKGKKTVTFCFTKRVNETKAHHPYMIHPAMHKGTQTGVRNTIVGISKQPEKAESLQANKEAPIIKDGVTYTFIGSYDTGKKLQPYSYYYFSGDETTWPNGFYKWGAVESGQWTPYTACILASHNDGAGAKAIIMYPSQATDATTNGINTISSSRIHLSDGKVYTISGQEVNAESVRKGIYIINGRKIAIK